MKVLLLVSFIFIGVVATASQNVSPVAFRDDFGDPLVTRDAWTRVREPAEKHFQMTSRPGFLRLIGNTVTLSDTQVPPIFLGRLITNNSYEVQTALAFQPIAAHESAGLAARRSERRYIEFGIRTRDGRREAYVRTVIDGVVATLFREPVGDGAIELRIRRVPEYYRFAVRIKNRDFREIGGADARILRDDKTDSKENVLVGPFASGNGREKVAPADFDFVEFKDAPTDPYANLILTEPTLPPGWTIFSVDTAERGIIKQYPFISRPSTVVPDDVEARRGLVYEKYGDREMHVDLFKPKRKGRFPAVIIVHGGAWITGHHTMENPLAIVLARRGYVAVTVEHRLMREKLYPAQIHDLKSSVRWLRANAARFGIDPKRIGAVGASSGGHLVALLGSTNGIAKFEGEGSNLKFSSRVQSVVDIDGTATFDDPGNVAKELKGPWNTNTRLTGFTYAENPAIWREASPITHVHKESAPTLFLNSSSFRPFQQREEMRDKLLALGIHSDLVVIPDTPHPFWLFRPWFDDSVVEIDRFLKKTM